MIGDDRTYEDLVPHATDEEFAPGQRVRVLDLETLIATKEHTGREKTAPFSMCFAGLSKRAAGNNHHCAVRLRS